MSPSCMLLRQFQFCVEIPYQLSFRAIIAKEGKFFVVVLYIFPESSHNEYKFVISSQS